MDAINPTTGTTVARYDAYSLPTARCIVEGTWRAWQAYRSTTFEERAGWMRELAVGLRARADELARLMAIEMGKPVREGVAEVEKCAWVCDFYADHAESFLAPEPIETDARDSYVAFRPLGVVLAVMPWNFPLWQVFRFAAPALMAGNGGLLKHASNVPGCAMAIEELVRGAGFPPEIFRTLLLESDEIGQIIEHPQVAAVTLTGSTRAGRAVGATAGRAIKKSVLELGGSDPYLILADADIELAVARCAQSRLINSGQSCIAAKRFVVVPEVLEAFERGLVETMKGYVVGDPLDRDTQVGPMARIDLRDELHAQVRNSIEAGARCLLGGEVPQRAGAWYPPTVLTGVAPGMPAYDEELFGPVAAIIPVADEAEAVRVANDSSFGLGAAVFSRDVARAERLARDEIEAGCCFVNDFVRSDPRLPFGGVKESGYGRELGRFGIREFVNIKTVYVGTSSKDDDGRAQSE